MLGFANRIPLLTLFGELEYPAALAGATHRKKTQIRKVQRLRNSWYAQLY